MLNAIVGEAKLSVDKRTQQLNAFATPAQQAVIAQILKQLQSASVNELQPRLEVYQLDHSAPDSLIAQLKIVVPDAILQTGSTPDQLVVFATSPQHEAIKQAMKQLNADIGSETQKVPVVYTLKNAEPSSIQPMIQSLYPRAHVTIDNSARRVVVIGTPRQQDSIGQFLRQLDALPNRPMRVATYNLGVLQSAEVMLVVPSPSSRCHHQSRRRTQPARRHRIGVGALDRYQPDAATSSGGDP